MGTTAEKLSYLNETKTKIKNSLETPSNTFRDYPDLIKKYIDNQPTKVVSDGVCDNAVDLPIKGMGIDGNYEQKTTDGRQLFDNTLKDYAYYGNLAKTISTGVRLSVSSPITTSDIIFTVYSIMDLSNFVGKTVRMKATYKSNSALTGKYKIGLCDDKAGNRNAKASSSFTGQEISFIVPEIIEKQKYLAIWFYTNAGGTGATGDYVDYTNVIVTIDNEDMTYEPYTGGISSPNPDYKQDVEVIDGYNKLDFKTMLKNADAEFTESKGVFTISSRRMLYNKPFKLNLKPNYTYTMYQEYQMQETPNLRLEILKGETYDVVATSWTLKEDLQDRKITFTTDENSNYYIRGNWGAAVEPLIYNQPILVEGTELKPYLPYGYIDLEQSGKNKVDFINYVEKVFDSSKVEKLDDGSYKFKHSDGSYPLYEGLLKPPCTLSFWAKNETGEAVSSYTFSFKIFYEDGTYDRVSMITNGNFARKEFKINKNVIKIANTYTITKPYTIIKDVQLEEGSIATSYEPYHETKVIPIDLQRNTLARVGDIKDKLIIHRNGEVELMKNIWKKNISITSIIEDSGTKMAVVGASGKKRNNRTLNTGLCTKAIMTKGNPLYNGTFYENATNFVFVGANEDTLETMKSKYDNAELYYQLETPQIIKLPSINPIDLWQGTNIFKLITNLETNFEVEYVVDKDSMLDEVQTAMLNAEIEI